MDNKKIPKKSQNDQRGLEENSALCHDLYGTDEKRQINSKRGGKVKQLISIILIIAGVLFIAVPLILTYLNTKRNDEIIEDFLRQSEQDTSQTEIEAFYIPEDMAQQEAVASEESLSQNESTQTPTITPSETSSPSPPQGTKKPAMSKEEIKKRMKGVLVIPKIDVKLIIMDGVDEKTLLVAVGRLPESSKFDEIGNCVLAGHRSYTLGKYLNRLDELVEGDEITIQTKDKTFKYSIYKKLIVEPTDFSITKKSDTEKILTVFTCHPPGIGSHRLVVHAKQIE